MLVPKLRFKREDGTDYSEWEEDTIGNCVNVTSCKRVHQSDWTDSGVPFYRAREIVALYNNEPITPLHISIEKYNALSKISGMISSGDLLVTGVGTIGVPYLVKESDKFYFKDGNIIWFQNEEKRALGSFLYYTLSTNEFQTKILQDSGKGTVHTFTIANAKETIIAIPCLEEQQKIADFLSTVDEVIAQSEAEVQNLEQQKKAAMQKIFSQEVRFKREDGTEYPEWEQYRLEDTVDFLDEKRKPITSKYRKAGQYPYYGASGIIDFIDDYIFDEELVLLSEDGANIVDRNYRVAFIATGKYWVNNHAHCLRPKQGFASYFISEALESIDYTVYNTGSAQPKLNQEVCRNLPLMCPCLEEQQKIADFLSAYDEAIRYAKQELDKWKELKKGLLQQMLV